MGKTLQENKSSQKESPSDNRAKALQFNPVTHENMEEIWRYIQNEPGRTTDFSYGGILMWVDYFKYEYCIYEDTLFIKGVVENDIEKPAFSIPIGKLSLSESISILKDYCRENKLELEFSAVPEYALEEMSSLHPSSIEELSDWGDYLYDAEMLATVKGKKMNKKRNHINQFLIHYPDYRYEPMTKENAKDALAFMDIFDLEGDSTDMARVERGLSRQMIGRMIEGDTHILGGMLYVNGEVAAYTLGDIKGDTLFIHIEKATRHISGSYEMINHLFAENICGIYPEIKFINREDDAGDEGLRKAKESYHPIQILKKYNITF